MSRRRQHRRASGGYAPSSGVAVAQLDGKAGPLGPGAGPLMTEFNLHNVLGPLLGQKGTERMTRAMKVGMEVDWIRAAERAIRDALVRCDWHLEDPDEEVIDAEYKGHPAARMAFELLEAPQGQLELSEVGRRQTRRQQLTLTSRHLGTAGNAAWMTDAEDDLGLPHAILYIRPDRLTPACNDAGVLTGWVLDKRPGFEGTPIELDELHLLQFDPPDMGVFGPGLVESAATKAVNSGLIDKHFQTVLTGGGRISGVLSPKEGVIPDDIFKQLVLDWRNITEQPDAARRLQIVKAPVEFTSTVQTAAEMALIELMAAYRDAGLMLWGVPLTMLNGQNAGSVGLNGGESRKYDEAVLWQSAVESRLEEVREAYQAILDRWEPVLGWAPKLVYEPPSYDDETPAYDRAQKAREMPMRNAERRAMVGLEPFGDPSLDNQVLLPMGLSIAFMAPDEDSGKIPTEVSPDAPEEDRPQEPPPGFAPGAGGPPPPNQPPGQKQPQQSPGQAPGQAPAQGAVVAPGKATMGSGAKARTVGGQRVMDVGVRKLRDQLDERIVPRVQTAVARALDEQGDAIAAAVEANWDHITRKPGDASAWWREPQAVERALMPGIGTMAEQVEGHLREAFTGER